MKSSTSLKAYYAERASEYDAVYAKPERQLSLRKLESWLPGSFKNKHVLEVACGTGYWTQFITPEADSVTAIDAADETLAIAKLRPRNKSVLFLTGDAYALPSNLPSSDAAFAGFWLSHVPQQRQRIFLKNLHAQLQPESSVVFVDNLYVEGSSTPICETDKQGNTYQIRRLCNGTTHRVIKNFPSKRNLERMIEGLGTNAEYLNFDYYWAFLYKTGLN